MRRYLFFALSGLLLAPLTARADYNSDAAQRDYEWAKTTGNSDLINLASNYADRMRSSSNSWTSNNYYDSEAYRQKLAADTEAVSNFERFQKENYAEMRRMREEEEARDNAIRRRREAQNKALDDTLQAFFGGPELPDFDKAWQKSSECDQENGEVKVLRAYMTMTGQGTFRDTEGGRRELEQLCGGFEKVPQSYYLSVWLPRCVARYLMGKTLCEGVYLPEDVELGFKYLLNTQLLEVPHTYCTQYWISTGDRLPLLLKRLQLRELVDRKQGSPWYMDPIADADVSLDKADPATKLRMAIYRADVEDIETQTFTRVKYALYKIRDLCQQGYEPAIMEMVMPGPTGHYFDLDSLEAVDAAFERAYPLLVKASAAGDKRAAQALSEHNNGIQAGLVFSMYSPGDDGETFFATHRRADLALGMGWFSNAFKLEVVPNKEEIANRWFDIAQTLPVTPADVSAAYDRAQLFLNGRDSRPKDEAHALYWLKVGRATDPRCRELLAPYDAAEAEAQKAVEAERQRIAKMARSEAEAKQRYLTGNAAWLKLAQTVALPPKAQLNIVESKVIAGETLEEEFYNVKDEDLPKLPVKTDYRALEIFAFAGSKGSFYGALHTAAMLHRGTTVAADKANAQLWNRVTVRLALALIKQGETRDPVDYASYILAGDTYPLDVEGGFQLLRAASLAGDSSAAGVMSSSYREGVATVAANPAKAAIWDKISDLLDGSDVDIAKAKALIAKN